MRDYTAGTASAERRPFHLNPAVAAGLDLAGLNPAQRIYRVWWSYFIRAGHSDRWLNSPAYGPTPARHTRPRRSRRQVNVGEVIPFERGDTPSRQTRRAADRREALGSLVRQKDGSLRYTGAAA